MVPKSPAAIVARNVKRLRGQRGWSQTELAGHAGLSSVGMIESGARPNARWDTLEKIAEALGVTVADLCTEEPQANATLLEFLASPIGSGAAPQERTFLASARMPGRQHTLQSYSLLLMAHRASAEAAE